jgi:hypothetical protein
MSRAVLRPAALLLPLLLGACAQNAPAGERGFFGGLGAAISGEDERQAQAAETRAQTAETRALEARAAAVQAEQRQAASASAVRDAERRLATLDRQIAAMRQDLAAARARRPNDPQGAALSGRIEQLDRDRAAAARAPDPTTAQRLERQGQELARALEAYGRL